MLREADWVYASHAEMGPAGRCGLEREIPGEKSTCVPLLPFLAAVGCVFSQISPSGTGSVLEAGVHFAFST